MKRKHSSDDEYEPEDSTSSIIEYNPPKRIQINWIPKPKDVVEILWNMKPKGTQWFRGTVICRLHNGDYVIEYDDDKKNYVQTFNINRWRHIEKDEVIEELIDDESSTEEQSLKSQKEDLEKQIIDIRMSIIKEQEKIVNLQKIIDGLDVKIRISQLEEELKKLKNCT